MTHSHQRRSLNGAVTPYQLFMLSLCVWAIATLAAGVLLPLDPETETILVYADTAVCGLFFLDFLYALYHAPRRLHYLVTWGWIDLLSSVPAVGSLRLGRAARMVRILRVIRGMKSARAIAHFVVARRAESAFLATILLSLLILVFCSVSVLQFEAPAEGNIQTAEDAMWWAMSTMTTVGYGDRYPITTEGRFIAVFLMAAGVGVFGTLSGLIASWFLSPAVEEADTDLEQLKGSIGRIQKQLDRLEQYEVLAAKPEHVIRP
jgi:voltage-gated potassium channel